ncbi:MAG: mevalonate kinase [Candidatus Aenigmarchaeota archaeon]|nr:mevalonate kinase [Candidatus Aenigmarchaeota archaeon]
MAVASAPGKCIIIGEHAVVYGEPAIFAAVSMRTTVSAEKSNKVMYKDKRWDHNDSWPLDEVLSATEEVSSLWKSCAEKNNFSELFSNIKANRYENYKKAAMGIALKALDIDGGISIDINSQLPAGAGLGSSASLAVAAVQAIAAEYKKEISKEEVNAVAYELEKIIHGTPSGGDNSACCYGGLIWFQKPNTILSLKEEIPYKLENFILVYTNQPERTTGELVQSVRNLEENIRNHCVHEIGRLTKDMREALKIRDLETMKRTINRNQQILAKLGVSTPEIDEMVSAIKEKGGAAKLCGAGGGGMVLCYHEKKNILLETIRDLGYEPLETDLAVEGVKIENENNNT